MRRLALRLSALAPLVCALALGTAVDAAPASAEATAPGTIPPAAPPAWVARSNENAKVLLDVMAKLSPESAAFFGVDGYDEQVSTVTLDTEDRTVAELNKAIATLQGRLASEQDTAVRQDLEILIDAAEQNVEGTLLQKKHNLPYFDVAGATFQGLRALLDDQIPAERRKAAVVRLRRYAGLEAGYTPLATQAETLLRARMANPALRFPFKDNLEKDLGNAPRYIAGIEKLFQKYQLEGWQDAYAAWKKQAEAYNAFLTAELLPKASTDFRLPAELYAYQLKQVGIDMPVGELTSRAKTTFREIQNEMQVIAPMVAKQKGLSATDYRDVIRELKKEQLQGDAILTHYQHRITDLEKLIQASGMLTLPGRPMRIRLASEAEAAATPAPNMRPPRLIGNTGEQGEFVLPLKIPAAAGEQEIGFDDFTFEAASWTLTAHEGRPGHELQFTSIVEKGVSQARVLFAFNSVNVEGWALYAEAEMKPLEPLDGQLIALQHRLMRAARAFLDPGLQLGQITREEAYHVLEDEVMLSHAMAQQEVERYTFWAPGQAPSYFTGYSRLMELRTDVERMLGKSFDKKSYHDFVLAQGLLPPALLRKAVMEQYVGPRLEQAKPAQVVTPTTQG